MIISCQKRFLKHEKTLLRNDFRRGAFLSVIMILFFPGAPDISDTLQPDQSVFIMMPLQMMYVFQRRITGQIFHFPYHVRLVGKTETGGTAGKICFLMQQNIPVDQIDQILKTDNSGKQFRSDCSFLRKDFFDISFRISGLLRYLRDRHRTSGNDNQILQKIKQILLTAVAALTPEAAERVCEFPLPLLSAPRRSVPLQIRSYLCRPAENVPHGLFRKSPEQDALLFSSLTPPVYRKYLMRLSEICIEKKGTCIVSRPHLQKRKKSVPVHAHA